MISNQGTKNIYNQTKISTSSSLANTYLKYKVAKRPGISQPPIFIESLTLSMEQSKTAPRW